MRPEAIAFLQHFSCDTALRTVFGAGRLMSAGSSWRKAADLRGKFGMTLNTNTAKALGLTVPPSFLVRVDEMIE